MSAFRLVNFVSAHLPEATDLWVEAWSRTMPAIDFERRRGWFVDRMAVLTEEGAQIVCAFGSGDGRMAGFVTLQEGHIDQLAVGVYAWGAGAGAVLLDEAKRLSQGYLYLDVNQDNSRAIRFYEREGFRRVAAGINASSGLSTWRYEWRQAADFAAHS